MHLIENHAGGYTKEKNGNKYLIFEDYVNENKALLKKYANVWHGIKNKIKVINGGEENNYGKNSMKIKFGSEDHLPLNKPLIFYLMTVIISFIFEDGSKLYSQVFLEGTLYEL